MVANQIALDKPEGKPKPRRLLKTWVGVQVLSTLVFVTWIEITAFVIIAIWQRNWLFLLMPLPLLKVHGYRQELSKNVTDTIRLAMQASWRFHGVDTWQHPRLEGVEVAGFMGWPTAARIVWRRLRAYSPVRLPGANANLPTFPYAELRLTVRRRDSHGDPKWLQTFADWSKRHYRYQAAAPTADPNDTNRDVVVLLANSMPDVLEVT